MILRQFKACAVVCMYNVSDYEEMFCCCTDREIVQLAEQALAVASVLHKRTTSSKFIPFATQAALNTNMRILSALARVLRGRSLAIRSRVVRALSSSVGFFHK